MTGHKEISYQPIPENQAIYQQLYLRYRDLHDAFGGVSNPVNLGYSMKIFFTP